MTVLCVSAARNAIVTGWAPCPVSVTRPPGNAAASRVSAGSGTYSRVTTILAPPTPNQLGDLEVGETAKYVLMCLTQYSITFTITYFHFYTFWIMKCTKFLSGSEGNAFVGEVDKLKKETSFSCVQNGMSVNNI